MKEPIFISKWPSTPISHAISAERRLLWFANFGLVISVGPFLVGSVLEAFQSPSDAVSKTGNDLEAFFGCGLVVGLLVILLAVLGVGAQRRKMGNRRTTALYLRPFEDVSTRKALENAIYSLAGSRLRFLQLADYRSNISPLTGLPVRLVLSIWCVVFLLGILETFGFLSRRPDFWDFALGMLVFLFVEQVWRKRRGSRRGSRSIRNLEELEAEVGRARLWVEEKPGLNNLIMTVAPSRELWPLTLRRLAPLADVILLDVSCPGTGLSWELSYCLASRPRRLLLVGREVEISSWFRNPHAMGPPALRMKELLAGQQILVYDRKPRAFSQSLLTAVLELSENNERT